MAVSNVKLVDSALGTSASPPSSIAMNSAASLGDVIVADVVLPNASGPGTVTVSDSLGNTYSALGTVLNDTTHNRYIAKFWTVVTHAGTPTVSASLGTAKTGRIEAKRFNGWGGTPTAATALATTASGAATSSLVTVSAAAATSQNNTIILATIVNNDVWYVQAPVGAWCPSSPDSMANGTGGLFYYGYSYFSPQADSGGTVPLTFQSNTSTAYGVSIAAIYDSGASLPSGARPRQFFRMGAAGSNPGATSFTGQFPQATLAGSALVAYVVNSNDVLSGNFYQPSDPVNGNWPQLDIITNAAGSNINCSQFLFAGAAAIPGADLITLSNAKATDDFSAFVIEWTGVSSSPLVTHTTNVQTGITSTSPDAVTTGSMSAGSNPAVVLGFVFDSTGNNTTQENAPVPGTGFTGYTWYFWPASAGVPGDGNVATVEWQHFTSPGSQAATFTVPYTSSDSFPSMGMVLAESLPGNMPLPSSIFIC